MLVVYAVGSAAYYTSAATTTNASPPDHDDPDVQAFLSGLDWLITGIGN